MSLTFFCLAMVLVVRPENKDRAHAQLHKPDEAVETIVKSWFPDDAEFNETCVSEGCPALTNFILCPKLINVTVLHNVLKTAIGCLKKSPMCGIDIDMRPTQRVTSDIENWLPGTGAEGVVATHPVYSGYLTNVSNIDFRILHDIDRIHQLPLQISMFISNMRYFGGFQLNLSLRTISPLIFGQALSVTVPDTKYDSEVEYGATMLVNHSLIGSNLDMKLLNPFVKVRPTFCGLDVMPEGFPSIVALFTSMAQMYSEKSSWAVRKAAFLEKYFQSAIRIVSNNC